MCSWLEQMRQSAAFHWGHYASHTPIVKTLVSINTSHGLPHVAQRSNPRTKTYKQTAKWQTTEGSDVCTLTFLKQTVRLRSLYPPPPTFSQ